MAGRWSSKRLRGPPESSRGRCNVQCACASRRQWSSRRLVGGGCAPSSLTATLAAALMRSSFFEGSAPAHKGATARALAYLDPGSSRRLLFAHRARRATPKGSSGGPSAGRGLAALESVWRVIKDDGWISTENRLRFTHEKYSPNTRFEGGGGGKPRRSHCEPVAAWCSQSTWVSRLNTRPPSTPTTPHTIGTLAPHMGLPSRPTTTFTTPPTACHTIEQGLQRPRPHPRRRRRQTRARRGRRRRRARRYGSAPPAAVHALPPPQPSRVTTARSHHASRAPSADLDSPPPRQDPNAPDPKNVTQKAPKEFGNFLSGKKPVSLSLGSGATNRRRAVCQCHPPKNAR